MHPPRHPAERGRLTDWQGLLERHAEGTREILGAVLVGRLVFTPDHERKLYEFTGRWSIGRALAGIVLTRGMVTPGGQSANGCEPRGFFLEGLAITA